MFLEEKFAITFLAKSLVKMSERQREFVKRLQALRVVKTSREGKFVKMLKDLSRVVMSQAKNNVVL